MPLQLSPSSSSFYRPGGPDPEVDSRKAQFDKLNAIVMAAGGWVVSVPGATLVSIEVLPESGLPDELRRLGYHLEPDGSGERILPAAIRTEVITEGSTVAIKVSHAGIVTVWRFGLRLV